ncbi:MAG TPA: ferritin-like domain-containing protein [Stellaceae bacterium]|nr:ferritin-like domain-containing protein [Stellaceae bacterium]
MGSWTLDDIAWNEFDRDRVDPDLLPLIKAASVVEGNGADYARYLCNIFHDDPVFCDLARIWASEEIQHAKALGRWAELADPDFDHDAACARFSDGFRVDLTAKESVRGSRSGELVARCIVETGTSTYYTALSEATREPVLASICCHIAADEFRHYKLFYTTLKRYLTVEGLGRWGRLRVTWSRLAESEDDELAYSYYAANGGASHYDRHQAKRAYAARAYAVFRRHHIERGISMVLKAAGLPPQGRVSRVTSQLAWWGMQARLGTQLSRRQA